ncbi:RAB11-binding protein RELCH-like [Cervus canadensis]|uniref:RAB11-binding protein RELCH-like n=1 Tax=Cervus canadensis TaxID=1574408 RepID=UPI001C9E8BF8|nr:RAB11-binding protein RELCH-like [Cervus canadensis]
MDQAGSISTLDSLDFARYSDDGNRETDERVAVLELELWKAKETIQALRADLTKAAEHEVPLQERKNYKSSPEIQDFELWDDVGLNIPKPPDSLQPYRDFGNHQVTGKTLWTWPVM